MKLRTLSGLAVLFLATFSLAHAAELAGRWTAEFETQIGTQKYVYEFAADGDTITGKATFDHSMGKGEAKLSAIKLKGDDVAFTESQTIEGNELTITYSGKISGDEMKLTRQVGDFATEQVVAKRAAASTQQPAGKK